MGGGIAEVILADRTYFVLKTLGLKIPLLPLVTMECELASEGIPEAEVCSEFVVVEASDDLTMFEGSVDKVSMDAAGEVDVAGVGAEILTDGAVEAISVGAEEFAMPGSNVSEDLNGKKVSLNTTCLEIYTFPVLISKHLYPLCIEL